MSSADTDVKSVTPQGLPVRKRVSDAATAAAIYNDSLLDGVFRAQRLTRVKAVIDGNAPWDPNELTRLGQGWRANFSTREGRAIIGQSVAASWELHWEVPTLIETQLSPVVLQMLRIRPEDAVAWCRVIDEEYTRAILAWDGFCGATWQSTHDMFTLGYGAQVWPHPLDWRPKAIRALGVKMPATAAYEVDRMEILQLDDELTISEAFMNIADENLARKAGWSVAAVRAALVQVYRAEAQPQEGSRGELDWGTLQRKWVEGATDVQRREHEPLRVVHTLVKEFDGTSWKVSWLIHAKEMPQIPLLFERRHFYRKMSEAVWFITYESSDSGRFHAVKGLGHDLFAFVEYSNRFVCQGLDASLIAASLLVKPRNQDMQSIDILRLGPVTVLPNDVDIVAANNFAPPIQGLVQMRGLMRDILHNNTGVFRPNSEQFSDTETPKTARQIVSEEAKEARFEKNKTVLFYQQWQRWHREVFRRMTNPELVLSEIEHPGKEEALDFVRRCEARGVPLRLLLAGTKVFDVAVTQAVGLGSVGAKMDISNQLMSARGTMTETSRRYVERYWAAVRVGWRNVDRVFPLPGEETPTQAESFASLENNDFAEGRQVPVGNDQEHARHVVVHVGYLMAQVQGYERSAQDVDVRQGAALFAAALPHVQRHLEYLSLDDTRAEFVAKYTELFKGLEKTARALQAAAQRVDESEAGVEGARTELVAKAQDIIARDKLQLEREIAQGKIAIEAEKQNSINTIRAFREETQQQLKTQQQQFQQALALQDQQFKQRLELLKAGTGGKGNG